MPIYPDLQLVFVHNPKTAGGSIGQLLQRYQAQGAKTPYNRLLAKFPFPRAVTRSYWPVHASARYIRARMEKNDWDRYTSFSIVRNPYDLAISHYEFVRQTPTHHRNKRALNADFESYIASRPLTQMPQFADQNGRVIVDHLLQFETLHKEIDLLFASLGISERLPRFGNANSSQKAARVSYLTPRAISIINAKAAQDFDVFGYEKTR